MATFHLAYVTPNARLLSEAPASHNTKRPDKAGDFTHLSARSERTVGAVPLLKIMMFF